MKRDERRWIYIFASLVIALTSVPYLLGFAAQGEDWVFTGFVYGVEDGNSYIAKMLQGLAGEWLFRSPYSSLPQRGVLAFLPFLLLGKLAAGIETHLQLVVLYHLFRSGATLFAIYATYRFNSLFIKPVFWRRWATVAATIGGGVGWFLILTGNSYWLGSLPLEWYSPEWFGFLSFYGLPHMLLARGLLLSGLCLYLSSPREMKRGWYAGLVFFVLSLVHPLSLVSVAAIVVAHQISIWLLSWRAGAWRIAQRWIHIAARSLILPAPMVLYSAIQFSTDPFLQAWTDQNVIRSPHPLHILIAYGLMLVPGALGVGWLRHRRRWTGRLILAWMIILPILAYAPHNLQRRFPEGIWVAIVTLAALGFLQYFKDQSTRAKRFGTVALLLSVPSAILLLFGGLQVSLRPDVPVFRPVEEVEVFEWLRVNTDPGIVVLSNYQTGNALPAWVPGFVVIGHGPESAHLVEFRVKVNSFYSGHLSPSEQLDFLHEEGIDFVFYGPAEEALGELDLGAVTYLRQAFQAGPYQIYEVVKAQGDVP